MAFLGSCPLSFIMYPSCFLYVFCIMHEYVTILPYHMSDRCGIIYPVFFRWHSLFSHTCHCIIYLYGTVLGAHITGRFHLSTVFIFHLGYSLFGSLSCILLPMSMQGKIYNGPRLQQLHTLTKLCIRYCKEENLYVYRIII